MWWWLMACTRVLDLGGAGPSDTSAPTDSGDDASVCLPGSATGYEMPSPQWALAALHAERQLDGLDDSALTALDADFVLALTWQQSAFDCGDYGVPWGPTSDDEGGCLRLTDPVVWQELCRLYPDVYDCDAYDGFFVGDRPATSALSLAWFALAGHALLGRYGEDPDGYYGPTRPRRLPHATAVMVARTPWFAFDEAFADCDDDLAPCVDPDLAALVGGLDAKLDTLDGASCYDADLTEDDVVAYVDELRLLWPGEDWDTAEQEAVAALGAGSFSEEAPAVLDALDDVLVRRLLCPERELSTWYSLPCP